MTAGLHTVVVEYFEQEGEEVAAGRFRRPRPAAAAAGTLLTSPRTAEAAPQLRPKSSRSIRRRPPRARSTSPRSAARRATALKIGGAARRLDQDRRRRWPALTGQRRLPGRCAREIAALCPQPAAKGDARRRDRRREAAAQGTRRRASRSTGRWSASTASPATSAEQARRRRSGSQSAFSSRTCPKWATKAAFRRSLTGVGAKLNPEWLRTVFDQGAKDRPYMFTRMPKFGIGERRRADRGPGDGRRGAHQGRSRNSTSPTTTRSSKPPAAGSSAPRASRASSATRSPTSARPAFRRSA